MSIRLGKSGFVLAALLAIAQPVFAATWYLMWLGKAESLDYFDADTVEKSRDSVKIWINTVQVNRADSGGVWSQVMKWRFQCKERRFQLLALTSYDAEGNVLKSGSFADNRWDDVVPGSTGERALGVVCAADFPKNKKSKDYVPVPGNDVIAATRLYAESLASQPGSAPK